MASLGQILCRVAGVMLISSSLFSCHHQATDSDDSRYVKVFVVGSGADQAISTFHGVVHAEFEPNLAFRVSGKIIERKVDIGQSVTKGQILASLDATDYRLAADSAQAQLAAAKSNLVTQQANLERYHQLLQQNFVSQAQYDTQKAQYESAKAQYEQATNQLANNQHQVTYTVLKAPAAGVITSINMDAGQVVNAAQTVATMAVSGAKEVEVELPEAQINDYKAGLPAKVQIWATDKSYVGKIRIINQASDQQTRTYTARILIENADVNIKYGMAADVYIKPLNWLNGNQLPLSCLYANEGKSYVWVLDNSSRAKLVSITVLATDGSYMKITSGSLHYGDKVVDAGTNLIYAGQKLKVYND